MKVASGGELSRFLLALKVALADRGSAPTLVFDEIDTGVGGAVADAIGQRLKRLSSTVQVLSVTHAPQVAARADTHLLISKGPVEGSDGRIATRVAPMDESDRARGDRPHAGRRLDHRRGPRRRRQACCRAGAKAEGRPLRPSIFGSLRRRTSPSSACRHLLPAGAEKGACRLVAVSSPARPDAASFPCSGTG